MDEDILSQIFDKWRLKLPNLDRNSMPKQAVEYKSILLDQQSFCAQTHMKSTSRTDNTCFVSEYADDDGTPRTGYGIIQRIFAHTVQCKTMYFILPKWYQKVEGDLAKNPVSGLQRIKPAPAHWERQIEVADNLFPTSCVFWPSDPLKSHPSRFRRLFDVVIQRNPVYQLDASSG